MSAGDLPDEPAPARAAPSYAAGVTGTPTLLGPGEIRALAARLGVRPTKALGQNFVHDANTIRRIVRAAELDEGEVVLEVGPGLGSLTLGLLPAAGHLYAVEIDPVLAGALPGTVARHAPAAAGRLSVLRADALKLRPADLTGPAPTALVANLPYNVAVPVLLHLLATFPHLDHGLVMVQQEVADRLAAPPGSKVYGVPSVKLAWYARARQVGRVPPAVFWPVPNVDSGLVAFRRCAAATGGRAAEVQGEASQDGAYRDGAYRDRVFAVVDAAFAQRRKTLRAALAGWAGGAAEAERVLRAAGVDPGARGESLTVREFAAIAAAAARPRPKEEP